MCDGRRRRRRKCLEREQGGRRDESSLWEEGLWRIRGAAVRQREVTQQEEEEVHLGGSGQILGTRRGVTGDLLSRDVLVVSGPVGQMDVVSSDGRGGGRGSACRQG